MTEFHSQITSLENIKEAYLDLYYSLTLRLKVNMYNAINGKTLGDAEAFSAEMIQEIQDELLSGKDLQPAKYAEVSKLGRDLRGVYMLPIKERVKCQAIYRVLEPYFEERYSDCLYSFRSTKPSYYAARSVRRLYLRNYKKKNLYVLKLDIHKYSDYHNHEYLNKVLKGYGIEDDVMGLIDLFIRQPFIHKGKLQCLYNGTMQGSPLCSIFNNIYIGHIDKYLEERAHFYRRVGDDLIIIDEDKDKLIQLLEYIKKELKEAKLIIKKEKTVLVKLDEEFNFLGYRFENGKVGFPDKTIRRILDRWKRTFKYKDYLTLDQKIKKLKEFFNNKEEVSSTSKNEKFLDIVRVYNLATDTAQIKELSSMFINVLTNYFMNGITYKKKVETKKILKKYKFPSLTRIHYWYSTGMLKKYNEAKKSVDKLIKSEEVVF
jgi:hypothetical protein